eukprot:5650810-Pyramimonas_sp.AAC.1
MARGVSGGPRRPQAHAHRLSRTTEAHSRSNSFTLRLTPSLSILKPVWIQSLLPLGAHSER